MSDRRSPYRKIYVSIQIAILAICLFAMFDGHHPPAYAQDAQARPEVAAAVAGAVENALQDQHIVDINAHLVNTDARVQKQWDAINDNKAAIAALHADIEAGKGEQRGIGGIVSLLAGGGLALQIKSRRGPRRTTAGEE